MNKFLDYFFHHPAKLLAAIWSYFGHLFSDEIYLKIRYRILMHKALNLNNPKTFSEKLQWLKLYNRNPEYTKLVDKYAVKDYVAGIIGDEYVIPTLGVWDNPEDIEWDKLPSQFVLKTTHAGGSLGVVICKDKYQLDRLKAISKLKKSLNTDAYRIQLEWPYKNVPRRIIAEKYIEPAPEVQDLPDYKWYCFNGEPKFCQVIQNRNTLETIDFFTADWHHQDFIGLSPDAVHADILPACPTHLDTHLLIARKLSKGIPFSRIDLYETGDRTYFGEITFYPASGFGEFRPDQYNEILGAMLELPEKVKL